jgi:signal transduction histidine kinase
MEQEMRSIHDILTTQEQERTRIAKDLHDRLGSILSTAKLYFSSAEAQMDQLSQPNKSQLYKGNELLDEACYELRRISHDLASGELIRLGLVAAVKQLAKTIQDTGKVDVTVWDYSGDYRISAAAEITLFRVIQELLNNMLKHSGADRVGIQFIRQGSNLNILIEDNGAGFVLAEVQSPAAGLGLSSMQARVESLGGMLHIDTCKGRGTTTIIDIPV